MAALNEIARNTRLGMTEGPIATSSLTPEQSARATATVRTALGLAPEAGAQQLSAIAGARRSLTAEPRATVFNTLGQRMNALEKIQKVIADHYAQSDANTRRLARDQETATEEQEKMKETKTAEQLRQQTVKEGEQKKNQAALQAAAEGQNAAQAAAAEEERRRTEAAQEERLGALRAAETERETTALTAQTENQGRLTQAQKDNYDKLLLQQQLQQKILASGAYRAREEEKAPKRAYWEDEIKKAQDNYMRSVGKYNPNALLAYDEGLAQTVPGPGMYYVTIPEMPDGLEPGDNPDYVKPGGVLPLEDYLVDYDKSFDPGVNPAYTRVFWQLNPEDRPGYLAAAAEEREGLEGVFFSPDQAKAYLDSIHFKLDPDKPLIKEATKNHNWLTPARTPPTWIPPAPSNTPTYNHDLSSQQYLKDNPDVVDSGMSPWEHYNKFGKYEKRKWPKIPLGPKPPQMPAPNTGGLEPLEEPPPPALNYTAARNQYLQDNPDVARSGIDPWTHYILNGRNEGRVWPGEEEPQPAY